MIKILFFVLWLVDIHDSHRVHAIHIDDLEMEQQLYVINKPSVKSIQTEFEYIVDCVDIYKQPAFDHPLLKDHKLQRTPSFQKSFQKASIKNSSNELIFGLHKEKCPKGTVPIRRTTKDDLIQGKLSFYNQSMTQELPDAHFAEVYLKSKYGPYFKVSGKNSIYNPRVLRKDQTTISHIWVQNGPTESTNKITFGWHVVPKIYGGDTATYIYSSWTADNYKKTGCYNLLCSGFVQTHQTKYIGSRVPFTSVYGGIMVEFTISITQDPKTKNWWLNVGGRDIGYYPAKLFLNMTSADQVGWGGRTFTPLGTPSPQMGSGYFPDDNSAHACYFRFVTFQNKDRIEFGPPENIVNTYVDKSNCFNAKYYVYKGPVGCSIQFGGPGGECGN